MNAKREFKSALSVQKGVSQPPDINPVIQVNFGRKKRKKYSLEEFVEGILSGNRTVLSQAITLAESSLPEHFDMSQAIIEKCLKQGSESVRIGITGAPGVGKSTFIESLGLHIVSEGANLAVLTIDPSSEQTRGSILGDKTRMEQLSVHPGVFIRPSPATGSLGGVARKTMEAIILCEAAGFNIIMVETVGVGQSETEVHSMVDFFLLLMLAGAGDELQGIKRGIMEMADLIAITKADGSNKIAAENARVSLQNALSLFPSNPSGWKPRVLTCSAIEKAGVSELWDIILSYFSFSKKEGSFEELRRQQAVVRMHSKIVENLNDTFYNQEKVKLLRPEIERLLYEGKISSYKAAVILLDEYHKKPF
jgi:GTPase